MTRICDPVELRLLDEWQRGLPLEPRPFARMGCTIGCDEAQVLDRLRQMVQVGRVSRVGATCAPNTISASTLAAVSAPPERIEDVAGIIGSLPGVNHSYLRENRWNLWFVATGPDRAHIDATLSTIRQQTHLRVLDVPLVRPFNVDLGFSLTGRPKAVPLPRAPRPEAIRPGDRAILQALTRGLALVAAPFAELAERLGRPESDVIARIAALLDAGIVTRLGVIVRHRAIGWSSNAMVVWDIASEDIDAAGPALAAHPGVTLCYERRPLPGTWPYRLYCMIHARSRGEAMEILGGAAGLPQLQSVPYRILFSSRCFKQTGALIAREPEAAA